MKFGADEQDRMSDELDVGVAPARATVSPRRSPSSGSRALCIRDGLIQI
jgi:hypothetical protein